MWNADVRACGRQIRTRGSGCGRRRRKVAAALTRLVPFVDIAAGVPCFHEKEGSCFSFRHSSRFFFPVGFPPARSPNKAPEPTPAPVTIHAVAWLAPAALVAHL
jgi:hypothetical protein